MAHQDNADVTLESLRSRFDKLGAEQGDTACSAWHQPGEITWLDGPGHQWHWSITALAAVVVVCLVRGDQLRREWRFWA